MSGGGAAVVIWWPTTMNDDDDPLTQKAQCDGIVDDDDVRNVSSNKYLGRRGAVTEVISFWDDLRKH